MNKYLSTEDFIESQDPEIRPLLWQINRTILNAHPKMKDKISFGIPMFSVKHEVCYFGIIKKKTGIEIGFHRGYQMSNEQGILEHKNRKYIHGITFKDLADFHKKELVFNEILQESIILDEINKNSMFSDVLQAGRKKKKS
jgi:uncharacterized protein YdhG (YjbR/CyaY superfamily)